MALLYRVVENFDPYAVPNSNLVVSGNDFTVVYQTAPGVGKTKTLVIAFLDSSGTWLVGAEPAVMAKLPTPQRKLQQHLDADGAWHTWEVDGYDDSDSKERVTFEKQVATITNGVPIDISATKPVSLGNNRFAVGCRASAKSQLGAFRVDEIKKDASWIGSKVEDVVIEKVVVAEIKRF